jgi:hypothetical protein
MAGEVPPTTLGGADMPAADPRTDTSVPVPKVSIAGAPAGRFWLTRRESHSTRARRWCAWASEEEAEVEKEQRWPALAHRAQVGKVRLHFFLKLRQRSQAGMSRGPPAGAADEEVVDVAEGADAA